MRLPYGISNFAKLINDGCYFIDKTQYIEVLEYDSDSYLFYLRPRRFGKSLWISILNYYYGIEHKPNFENLFGKYYIGKHPTPKANSYYILKLEFSRIDTTTPESTKHGFKINLLMGLKDFELRYGISPKEYGNELEPANVLKLFLSEHKDKKIFLLIDEYDHFANEILSFRFDHFSEMVSRTGFVRKFYETIKAATGDGIVDRLFVTGVTPITLDSMTSGFNIATNISQNKRYHSMLGFTEAEVISLIDYITVPQQKRPLLLEDLRKWYNGYLFCVQLNERIYNPDMVLYFLKEYRHEYQYPDSLIDINIASDYGKIRRLFDLKNREQNHQVLEQLIQDNQVVSQITQQFSFEKPFTQQDFVSLLFYMGLISIREGMGSEVVLAIPNYVIQGLYLDFLVEILQEQAQITVESMDVYAAVRKLAFENQVRPILGFVEAILQGLSNRDFQKFNEKYVKVILIALLRLSNLYYVKSEPEINRKYPDIMLLYRPPFFPNYQFVFELKYLKKSEAALLEKTTQSAINQLNAYLQNEELRSLKNLKAYVVIFVGTEANVVQEIMPVPLISNSTG
ncbi:MAG: AAA family ATPase [Desulfobacterales bacterium]|nr:AAA family ATPase [Desulfobacterales bacterium]